MRYNASPFTRVPLIESGNIDKVVEDYCWGVYVLRVSRFASCRETPSA